MKTAPSQRSTQAQPAEGQPGPGDDDDDGDDDKSLSYKLPPVKGRCSELIGGFDHLVTPLSSTPIGY